MAVIHLTKDNFDSTIASGKTLVDFWAGWCGPCKMLAPTIEALAENYDGKAKVCKVDVDACPELAMRFGVMSIPTVIAFSDGKETGKRVGVQPMEELEALLD
jgi:thioredoxin 1